MSTISNKKIEINKNPFQIQFLAKFYLNPDDFLISDEDIKKLNNELNLFESVNLNPNIERKLISRNELLASFAISKAENSLLTLEEAESVYKIILEDGELDFISRKICDGKKIDQKDFDKLEFFNVAKTFRRLNSQEFDIKDLTPNYIKQIHHDLTKGLDIFARSLSGFTLYKSGVWRDNNQIRVGEYAPADFVIIDNAVVELVSWFAKNPSITNVAIFHSSLYALHPFNNGNKRVCRILEHILLKYVGLNEKNLFSTSYFYHQEKARYYKYLLSSLTRNNLNIFSSFVLEAITLSILGVLKTSLEIKNHEFVGQSNLDKNIKNTLKPLIKRRELQFKNFYKIARKKISRQTFVTHLEKAVFEKVLVKRISGKNTFYSLNIETEERDMLQKWLNITKNKISYIDDGLRLV